MSADSVLLAELEALEKEEKRRQRYSEWTPHRPFAKQEQFLSIDALEVLYGGAAGGGKSDALLHAALKYVDQPGYAALILRKTYKDLALPNAIMSRAHAWLKGTRAHWAEKDKVYTFPSGATLTFGYLDTKKDLDRYQGAELQYIGFDEATQFPEQWYRYLLSRLRRLKGSPIPLRARLGANPGGVGHMWVYRRFVEGSEKTPDQIFRINQDRVFVPAKAKDNPYLDVEEYSRSLAQLDETTRRQLEDGIWVQDAGGLVYKQPITIPGQPQTGDWNYLLGLDFGVKDATAFVTLGYRTADRTVYVIESWKETGLSPTDVAERVQDLQRKYGYTFIAGDVGGMGKAFAEEMRRRWGLPVEPAAKASKRGFQGLMNGALERGELLVVKPSNEALLKELAELPWKDESHLQEADGFDNHLTDALLYAWRASTAYSQKAFVPAPTDPAEIIRRQTAAIWEQYENDLARKRVEDSNDDHDMGTKFYSGDDW
jgi:hypothetical protein